MNGDQQKNALGKYLTIGIVRIMGIAMMALGFAIILNGFQGLETYIGYLLIFVGGFEFIVMPIIMARAWKTPEDHSASKNNAKNRAKNNAKNNAGIEKE